jgi:hypothetical protein
MAFLAWRCATESGHLGQQVVEKKFGWARVFYRS